MAAPQTLLTQPLVADSIADLIGKTPMLKLGRLNDTEANILLKMESENPMASVKDRLAVSIIKNAEKDGKIKPGVSTLIEATSGNTGVALAQLGAALGYKVIIVMPDTMSLERRAIIRLFGARLVLTPGKFAIAGALKAARKLAADIPESYLTSQFETEYNARIHKETTGPEIWAQTQGKLDYFVSGAGTGGTVTGVAQFLKSVNAPTKIITIEPEESQVLQGKAHSPHKIQGIGAGIKPDVIDLSLVDEITTVNSAEALEMARRLPVEEGIFAGISAGAAVAVALRVGRRPEAKGKTIVAVIPSFGERYLSTALFANVLDEVKAQATEDPDEVKA